MPATETTTGPKTLVSKLAEVMQEVGRIPKNGKNSFHNYTYVMESDLVDKLSTLLADRHVFITSSTKGIETVELSKPTKQGEIVTQKLGILRVEYTFHDGESGETLTMEGVGEIDQDGGKGLYKALTGSMKYFLMKNFLVATGDDPEQTPQQKSEPAKKAATAKAAPTKKAEAKPAPASTPEQQARILDLARELNMDVQRDICTPAKFTWPLTQPQAIAVITRLEQKKGELTKELKREVDNTEVLAADAEMKAKAEYEANQNAAAEAAMAQDERAGMAA